MASGATKFHEEVPLLPTNNTEQTTEPNQASNDELQIPSTVNESNINNDVSNEYPLWVAICFTLNYSIGAGILGLPFEFYRSGFILSIILLIILAFLSYFTMIYVVDGIFRAEAVTQISSKYGIKQHQIISNPSFVKQTLSMSNISKEMIKSSFIVDKNRYQLSELIGIFAGFWWRLAYEISFGLSSIIVLWSYNTLFAVSLARNFGIPGISDGCNMESSTGTSECRALYSFYVVIFYIWTVIITLMDFKHQQWLQVSATVARIIIIIFMIFTAIGLIYSHWYYDGDEYVYEQDATIPNYGDNITSFRWSGMMPMIAVAAFAYGNQFCVSDVVEPLSYKNKNNANKQHILWCSSVVICCVVYCLCGLCISLFYGSHTESPCTLAWEGFMGFNDNTNQPIWALIVSSIIILLPAIDIGSAFPLVATTLANTFEAIIYWIKNNNETDDENIIDDDDEVANVDDETILCCINKKRINPMIKILICTLCSILALVEWNFDLILVIAGSFRLLAMYIGPCILEWKSKQFINDIASNNDNENLDDIDDIHKTSVTKDWMSHNFWLIIISTISFIAFITIFATM